MHRMRMRSIKINITSLTAILQLEIIMADKTVTQRQTEPCDIPHAETTAIQETQAADKGELACSEPARSSLSLRLQSQAQSKTSGSSTSNSTSGDESEKFNDDATRYPQDETKSISPPSSSPENSNSAQYSDIDGDEHAQLSEPLVSVQPMQATGSPIDGKAAIIPPADKSQKYFSRLLPTYVNIPSGTCTSITDPRLQDRPSSAVLVRIDPTDEHRNPCSTYRSSSQRLICTQQHNPSGANAAASAVELVTATTCSYLSRDKLCGCISKTSSLSEFTLPNLHAGDVKVLCKLHPQGQDEDIEDRNMSLTAMCRLAHNASTSTSLISNPTCVIQLSIEVYEIGEREEKVVINSAHDCQELNDEDRRNFTKHMVVHAVASQSYFIFDSVSDKIYFKVTVEIRAS